MDLLHSPEVVVSIVLGLVSFVAWLVRLESNHQRLKERVEIVEKAHEKLTNRFELIEGEISRELKNIQIELAEIKGYLKKDRHDGD